MVQTPTVIITAVALGAASTMAAPTNLEARGKGQAILKGINKFGPGIVEHGLPIAGQFVPRELEDMEIFEREFNELEARVNGPAIWKGVNKFGPGIVEHGLPVIGNFVPREPGSRSRWGEAVINGGLDFANNAIQNSKQQQQPHRRELDARGKGQAIIKGINKFGPGIIEHGLPIAGQFVPREPGSRSKWGSAIINGGLDFANNAIQNSKQQQQPHRRELEARVNMRPILKGVNKFGPGVIEHGLPIAGQFVPREPGSKGKWGEALLNGGLDFANNAIQNSQAKKQQQQQQPHRRELDARGKGQAIIKGINKFGPGIVEHGLPIAGQFVPREFDAELFEREFDEFEAREIDELD